MGLIADGYHKRGRDDASELGRFNKYAIPRWNEGDQWKHTVIGWFVAYGVEPPDKDQPL